jgi:cell division protein FtsQ
MKIYNDLVRQLDSDGSRYSQALSEVDITDPEDVKVEANDSAGAVLVHLGSTDYLNRYRIYVTHIQGWRQQFDKLESVDLRYDKQIIVNPDMEGMPKVAPLTPAAAKAAMAAGVKSAALIHVVSTKPAPTNAPVKPVPTKSAPAKAQAKPAVKTTSHKNAKASHPSAHAKTSAKTPASASAKPAPAPAKATAAQSTTPHTSAAAASVSAATPSAATDPTKKKPSAAIAKVQDPSTTQAQKSGAAQDHP